MTDLFFGWLGSLLRSQSESSLADPDAWETATKGGRHGRKNSQDLRSGGATMCCLCLID